MKIVKFTKPYDKYSAGDIAGFADEKADWLVDTIKVAKLNKVIEEAPADPPADPPANQQETPPADPPADTPPASVDIKKPGKKA